MPSWVKDEAKWAAAKEQVKKEYPDIEESNDRFYKLVTHIYQSMTGTLAKAEPLILLFKSSQKSRPLS